MGNVIEVFSKLQYRFRWFIFTIFVVVVLLSAVFVSRVEVNYDMMSYLPKDSLSTIAMNKIEGIFGAEVSDDTRVMVGVSSIPEGLEYKSRLAGVPGIISVKWMDDTTDIHVPQSFIAPDTLNAWYKDGYALFHVTFDENADTDTLLAGVDAIHAVVGKHAAIAGGSAGEAVQQRDSSRQVSVMMGILVPVVLAIMIIATSSWLEPLLFLAIIGISILINMGTN
ncbi:MAG: MMPL family transporter, partial [Clostridiales Family XIII bacterium]|nr:MMPL family transporter [Clostridiales Family XIII bacterium]